MGLELNKRDVDLVTTTGEPIRKIEVEFSWQQPTTGGIKGMFGRGGVDVDATTIYYVDSEPTGYVSPDNLTALSGAMKHGGNVKKGKGEGSGERITIDLGSIREDDSDVEAFALVASCAKGDFNQVAEAVCRVYDVSAAGESVLLGNVRVPIQGEHTGVVIGTIKKSGAGWAFSKADKVRGPARTWRQLGELAERELTK